MREHCDPLSWLLGDLTKGRKEGDGKSQVAQKIFIERYGGSSLWTLQFLDYSHEDNLRNRGTNCGITFQLNGVDEATKMRCAPVTNKKSSQSGQSRYVFQGAIMANCQVA